MKKFIYKILIISLFFISVFTVKSFGESDFSYTLNGDDTATITAYNGSDTNLTIPNTIDGHNVVTIGSHAFDESQNSTNGHTIKNLVISEGIEKIELLAFVGCSNLETVKLPESLTFLGAQSFLQCSKLNSINIPSKLKTINDSTFQETNFSEFTIPATIQSIDSRALAICHNLNKVQVYSHDVTFADDAFEYSSSDLTLYGYSDSTTKTYAEQHGLKFKSLSNNASTMGRIYLNKTELSLKESESEILTVQFIEMDSTDIIWSSSNEEIATVQNGKVTANKVGIAVIKATTVDGMLEASCNLTVTQGNSPVESPVLMQSISLNKSALSLLIGDTDTLMATIFPSNTTDKNLVWSTSNSLVAIVENGKVTAKNNGSAIITVSNTDGTCQATCTVEVVKKENSSEQAPDNTIAGGKLPQTGVSVCTLVLLCVFIFMMILSYKHYKNLKNI